MRAHTPVRLTGSQKNAYLDLADNAPASPAFARTGASNPNVRVFIVNFDGTENKAGAPLGSDQDTLVAESHKHFKRFNGASSSTRSIYVPGVGTSFGRRLNRLQSVFGFGCKGRAEHAYKELKSAAKDWADKNPGVEVHVHVVGFSRGCASALHLMSLIDERGIQSVRSPLMAPGAVKSSAVLYDAVSTGVEDLKLTLPNSNISTLHIVAGAEERLAFNSNSLVDPRRHSELAAAKNVEFADGAPGKDGVLWYRRLHEITFPGARHSDIGGSYPEGGIRELSAYFCHRFQRSLGLPIPANKPALDAIQKMFAHDSRIVAMENDPDIRQNAWRGKAVLPLSTWDGIYSERCSGNCIPADRSPNGGLRLVRSTSSDQARGVRDEDLGTMSATWRLVPTPDGKGETVEFSGCRELNFNSDGGLMFRGARVLAGPSHADVMAQLQKDKIAFIKVHFEKALAVRPYDAMQGAPGEAAAPTRLQPRMLETEIRFANDHAAFMAPEDVDAFLSEAAGAAATELRSHFPEVRGVEVRIRPSREPGGEPHVAIICHRSGKREFASNQEISNGSDDVALADLALSEYVLSVRAGLRTLVMAIATETGAPMKRVVIESGLVGSAFLAPTAAGSVASPELPAAAAAEIDEEQSSDHRPKRLRLVR